MRPSPSTPSFLPCFQSSFHSSLLLFCLIFSFLSSSPPLLLSSSPPLFLSTFTHHSTLRPTIPSVSPCSESTSGTTRASGTKASALSRAVWCHGRRGVSRGAPPSAASAGLTYRAVTVGTRVRCASPRRLTTLGGRRRRRIGSGGPCKFTRIAQDTQDTHDDTHDTQERQETRHYQL